MSAMSDALYTRSAPASARRFRESALGMQLVLWAALGLGYGVLAERVLEPARA